MADTMSISEEERDRTVKALTKHCGDGRITLDELEQRIELAFAAQTTAELRELVRDLPSDTQLLGVTRVPPSPALQPHPSPTAPPPALRHHVAHGSEIALRVHTVVFLSVMALLVAIWVMAGFGYPWPIWVAMPWGAALAIHAGVHKAVAGSD
jgi:hypothetical protein